MSTPVLHLVAGPNGAGKSTLVSRVLSPTTRLPFVNADIIAAERWPDAAADHAYEASKIATHIRGDLISRRASFITETVFSHASKVELVDLAVARGYLVHLHTIMVPVEVSQQRHERLWELIVAATERADRAVFYDNTRAKTPFRTVATFARGHLIGAASWPAWTPAPLRRLG